MRKFKLEVYEPYKGKKDSGRRLFDADTGIPQHCPHASTYEDPSPCGNWCPKFDVVDFTGWNKTRQTTILKIKAMCGVVVMGEVVK